MKIHVFSISYYSSKEKKTFFEFKMAQKWPKQR